jgi:IS5 family transposase
MKPKPTATASQGDLFKVELISIISLQHPLVKLAALILWGDFARQLQPNYAPTTGASGISTRLMAALHILKFQYDLSDEGVVAGWVENPYWQFFSGMRFFSHQVPIDPSSMTRWRSRSGASGTGSMRKGILETGLKINPIRHSDFERINVDTTVQTKAIRYPSDARLCDRVRERLVKVARKKGLQIKHSYTSGGKRLVMKQSRYAHARQIKRAQACQRKFKTNLGRVIREVQKQSPKPESQTARILELAKRIRSQGKHNSGKVYSVHEPEVQWIAKGKAGKKYEFGKKVSLAVTSKNNWVVGALSFTGNPYGGHTLSKQLTQARSMIGKKARIKNVFADSGDRGHKHQGRESVSVDQLRRGAIPKWLWQLMKRRAVTEPTIGHLKSEHRLERNRLKGTCGDAVNALLSGVARNFGKFLAWGGRFSLFPHRNRGHFFAWVPFNLLFRSGFFSSDYENCFSWTNQTIT